MFTGTTNVGGGPIVIQATKVIGTKIDQIVQSVSAAQGRKAPIEKIVSVRSFLMSSSFSHPPSQADDIIGIFVPSVFLIAVLTLAVWLWLALSGRIPDADMGGSDTGSRVLCALHVGILPVALIYNATDVP